MLGEAELQARSAPNTRTGAVPGRRVDKRTLRERVLDQLRDDIISGRRMPGCELSEEELALDHGVSRGTVREALRALQQAHLVSGSSREILRVHKASPKEVAEIFNVRAALEGMAVRDIIRSPFRAQAIAELYACLPPEDLNADFTSHMNQDLHFHRKLCELSGNSVLLEQWCSLEDRMRIVFFSSGETHPIPIMAKHHHEPIVRCIETRDALKAQEVVRRHMEDASKRWAPDVDTFG